MKLSALVLVLFLTGIIVDSQTFAQPTAAFTPTSPCLGTPTALVDGSLAQSGDPIVSWNWSMPGGVPATATSSNASTLYSAAGLHSVTLVVSSQQGKADTITQQVIVYNPPVANFSVPNSGCAPVCANYTDLSTSMDGTINSWQWSFPGGSPATSSSTNPPNICYNTIGSYSATLTIITNYGCKDSLTLKSVDVYPWPTAAFTYTISGNSLSVTNKSSADVTNWDWSFGDGNTSTLQNPQHVYAFGNSYDVCLGVHNQHGCWDTICTTITILGVQENYLSSATSIFPSVSSSGVFNLSVSYPQINLEKIEAYDIVGNKVSEVYLLSGHISSVLVDLSGNANGIYFLKLKTDYGVITKKVVISK